MWGICIFKNLNLHLLKYKKLKTSEALSLGHRTKHTSYVFLNLCFGLHLSKLHPQGWERRFRKGKSGLPLAEPLRAISMEWKWNSSLWHYPVDDCKRAWPLWKQTLERMSSKSFETLHGRHSQAQLAGRHLPACPALLRYPNALCIPEKSPLPPSDVLPGLSGSQAQCPALSSSCSPLSDLYR